MGSPPPKHKFPQQFLRQQNVETENLLSNEGAQPSYRAAANGNQIGKKKIQFEDAQFERSVRSQRNEHTQAAGINQQNDTFQFEIGPTEVPQQQQDETNHQLETNSVNQTQAEINSGSHAKVLLQNEDEIKHQVENNSIEQSHFDKGITIQPKIPLQSEQLQSGSNHYDNKQSQIGQPVEIQIKKESRNVLLTREYWKNVTKWKKKRLISKILYLISVPIRLCLYLTIPLAKKKHFQQLLATFNPVFLPFPIILALNLFSSELFNVPIWVILEGLGMLISLVMYFSTLNGKWTFLHTIVSQKQTFFFTFCDQL